MTADVSRPRAGRWIFAFVLVAAGAAGYMAWRARPSGDASSTPPRATAAVTVETIERGSFPVRIESIGAVQPLNTVAVRARVDGQIDQAFFKEGETVKAGDLLLRLDARPFKAALDQAVAKRAQDQATLDNAKRDLQRYSQLAAKNFATEQQLNTQQATVASGQAQLDADDAAIESAQTQLSYTEIRAPIGGRIGFRQVDVGNIVHAADAQPMLSIVQVDPIVVAFSIPENRIAEVQEAMSRSALSVAVYTSDHATELAMGELTVLNNQVDVASGTLQAKATFANPRMRLWPGQSVIASLRVRDLDNVVIAPDAAVQRGPDGLFVWLVQPDDTVRIRKIAISEQGDGRVVVASGVSTGDRVVVAGQYRLYEGAKVSVSDATKQAASAAQTSAQ